MWAGIILLVILAYFLFFKKRAKDVPVAKKLDDKQAEKTNVVSTATNSPATTEQANPEIANQNSNQDEEKDTWFKSKYSSADESYVGPQDCIEPCDKRFELQRLKCFNKLNNGLTFNLPSSADDCIKLAQAQKIACVSKCTNAYPTNQNFNYDVRDNFDAIIGKSLFEQGYV